MRLFDFYTELHIINAIMWLYVFNAYAVLLLACGSQIYIGKKKEFWLDILIPSRFIWKK